MKAVSRTGKKDMQLEPTEGRVARRQRRVRESLVRAARIIMSQKGVDAATMLEIAEMADVGAGTVYNYFKSKDDLAIAVLEEMMRNLGMRIEKVTNTFSDPAQVYAFGIRNVIETATQDVRWRQLLNRSEVISSAIFRQLGPFAIRDLEQATQAGRIAVSDPALIWRMSAHAIVGVSLAITNGEVPEDVIPETVVRLLCMIGLDEESARELASRPRPVIEPEEA